ncbi:MAG: MBL fold metallo-hydrolase [Verrucomicrobiota bacterium]
MTAPGAPPVGEVRDDRYELVRLRSLKVSSFLLVEETNGGRRGTLVDTGILGQTRQLERALARLKMGWGDLQAILLTHGHLDHTVNLGAWRERTGAPVYAHPADAPYLAGQGRGRGWSRVGDWMEAVCRPLVGYRPQGIDRELADGERLPFWGGLEVVHLPGHTPGHCGFWQPERGILFSGDLAAMDWGFFHPSPGIFTADPSSLPGCFRRVATLRPRLALANHISLVSDAAFTRKLCARAAHETESEVAR